MASSLLYNNATNIGIGNTAPSQKLHVTGSARITGAFYDSNNDAGLSNLVLTSANGTGTDWMDVCTIIENCEVIQGLEANQAGWGTDSVSVMMLVTDTSGSEPNSSWVPTTMFGVFNAIGANGPLLFGSNTVDYDSSAANAGRMYYTPSNGSFRAGHDDINSWGLANQGAGSVAFGWNTKASGNYSDAAGYQTVASGYSSTARGAGSVASGAYSTASGNNSTSSGYYSTAMGSSCSASSFGTVALGTSNTASGYYAISIGSGCIASGYYSKAFGYNCTALGDRSLALGTYNTAQSYGETVLGNFANIGSGSATSFVTTDRLLTVGNGTSTSARGDALVILKSGNTGIGTAAPGELLHVGVGTGAAIQFGSAESIEDNGTNLLGVDANFAPLTNNTRSLGSATFRWTTVYATNGTISTSDIREKKNVEDLKYGLDQIMKLRPVSYKWNSGVDESTKLGLIAQELEKVIPEVVVTKEYVYTDEEKNTGEWKDADRLGVYYSDLIPVLVKGMQEQQEQITALAPNGAVSKAEFDALKAENEELKSQMAAVLDRLSSFGSDLQQCCFEHQNGTGSNGQGSTDFGQGSPILE